MRGLRRAMVFVAALPLLQVSQCQAVINQSLIGIGNQLPGILFNTFFSALLDTLLGGTGSLFGGGTGFGDGTGFGGGF